MTEGAASHAMAHRVGTTARRLEHLDMIRGLAALAVCIGHLRGMVFVDYGASPDRSIWQIPFYAATGLGGQAVIVFFALSGFLVGGPALKRIQAKHWNLPDYAVHRFARLWTGVIPALAMTAVIDGIGKHGLHLAGYQGEYLGMLSSGPVPGIGTDLSAVTFLGNIAFLMKVAVPTFGTNGPLWSLACEFAYYFTFPLAWLALRGPGNPVWRLAALLPLVAMILFYPANYTILGGAWLAGALAYLVKDRVAALPRAIYVGGALASALLLAITLPLTMRFGTAGELAFGTAWAIALPFFAALPNPGGAYGRSAFWLSEISFTLYVVHFPLAIFLWFALVAPAQYPVGATGLAIWAGLLALVLAYSVAMWWLFERNTVRIRRWAQRRLAVGS